MNPFALAVGVMNFAAAVWHGTYSEWKMATVWACYGVAGIVLAFVK